MAWLLNARNTLSLKNKTLIYKIILAPIWRYGIQVYGIAAKSNLNKIRVVQSQILRRITGAAWYIRNSDIDKELQVPRIGDVINGAPEPKSMLLIFLATFLPFAYFISSLNMFVYVSIT